MYKSQRGLLSQRTQGNTAVFLPRESFHHRSSRSSFALDFHRRLPTLLKAKTKAQVQEPRSGKSVRLRTGDTQQSIPLPAAPSKGISLVNSGSFTRWKILRWSRQRRSTNQQSLLLGQRHSWDHQSSRCWNLCCWLHTSQQESWIVAATTLLLSRHGQPNTLGDRLNQGKSWIQYRSQNWRTFRGASSRGLCLESSTNYGKRGSSWPNRFHHRRRHYHNLATSS